MLGPMEMTGHSVNGNLTNTGRGIMFKVLSKKSESSESAAALTASSSSASNNIVSPASSSSPAAADPEIVLTNGPLSYKYSLSHLELHFGREMTRGSEHSIDGLRFPAEIQLYFFNSQLYNNWDEAVIRTHGAAAVAILIQLNSDPKFANSQLKRITHALRNITSKGSSQYISSFSIEELMPPETRRHYMTYEGSLTQPSCQETVQWMILNRPIYMTSHLFHSLTVSMSSDNSHGADNFRPTQKLNGRSIRTNIDFVQNSQHSKHKKQDEKGKKTTSCNINSRRFWLNSVVKEKMT